MSQTAFSRFPLDTGAHRHAVMLFLVGVLCYAIAIGDGGVVFGTNPLGLAPFLVLAGLVYLVFALFTYRSLPESVIEAVLGALAASGLVLIVGTAGMYYEMVVVSGLPATTAVLADALAYSTLGTLLTLPVSAGWVAGTLIRLNKPLGAVLGIAAVTGLSGFGAATLLITLQSYSGAAAGFTQVLSYIAVIGAAGLAYLPLKTTAQSQEPTTLRDE